MTLLARPTANHLLTCCLLAAGGRVGLAALAAAPLSAPAVTARFLAVPPGPVTDQARVELRLGLANSATTAREVDVSFHWDRIDGEHRIATQRLTVAPASQALASAWWETRDRVGQHVLLWRVQAGVAVEQGQWPVTVVACATPALPLLQGAWIEPLAVAEAGAAPAQIGGSLRDGLDAMHRLGLDVLIITYVEYGGRFFYPAGVEFDDREANRRVRGTDCTFDQVGAVLDQADRNGMHVFLGLGRGGDTQLLWEFGKEDWATRNAAALDLGQRVAQDLHARYRHHPSLYGWYLTHEMNDLAKASAYYDPLADACHALAPEMPVLVAPAGTPVMDRAAVRASHVDILAFQDAVGAGYVPYRNTFQPEQRIAMLDAIFTQYRQWLDGSDKHLWADLEVWEMDGTRGYAGAFPAAFGRVRRQIASEARYVELLTGYAWFGYLRDPASQAPPRDPRADLLYRDYARHRESIAGGEVAP